MERTNGRRDTRVRQRMINSDFLSFIIRSFEAMASSFLASEENPSSVDNAISDIDNGNATKSRVKPENSVEPDKKPESEIEYDETGFALLSDFPNMNRASSSIRVDVDVTEALKSFRKLWNLEPIVEEIRQTTADALEILLADLSKDVNVGERKELPRTLLLIALHPVFEGLLSI